MAQNNDSARAVQYLHLNQDDRAPEVPAQRPAINVPIDLGYSLQRFVNSHAHVEDRVLRPLQHFRNCCAAHRGTIAGAYGGNSSSRRRSLGANAKLTTRRNW
ncbi:hypothetical protein O1611_g9187 [Lasiodiplodia mahajangana]|uniref:Uncharacterized protein n=1 Tax=Lasiodiplodia mahajangana TaxID=1108764 RepID=A0ACC2JBC5_9PEZI|nr:hypothetical protein O1611_g9187 [Lasiodiplodia mahajangana]